ncbi:hypothetical protein M3P21_16360 [Ruegeria sp. 2012CJ41-6]|uniref:Uncharacterized protein n=1 Tax=Ruegeria spongiae TaxID=2942209 RepID=A0ABT0Q5G9_9RHOB|nr:hypothetical protein [Ruegeria spongiae]MCL6285104.1 hypothetical protein [Ruegeria spongiae]
MYDPHSHAQTPHLDRPAIDAMLAQSKAWQGMSPADRDDMAQAMSKVFGYLGQSPANAPARQMAPNFNQMRGSGGGAQPPTQQPPPPAGGPAPGGAPPGGAGGSNIFQDAGDATQTMLGAIGFPDFCASLIQGTFQAIVDSSIQQMEAYSNLLAETAKTVDVFMEDNISDDMARDHLTSNYGDIFQKDISSGQPQMAVNTQAVGAGQLPSFLKDLGFDSPMDLDQNAVEQVVVPQTRKTLAEMRHQSLATMVMMGINRIVVSDGEINAKLVFHIDASQSTSLTFSDYKPTNWSLAGQLGSNQFAASGLLVNTTNINAQSEINMNADLTGEVRVRFRSDYFPLERFADSAAIQLINQNAHVATQPQQQPEGAVPGQGGETPPQPAAPLPPPPPLPPMDSNGGGT